jgi:hypothetical protein
MPQGKHRAEEKNLNHAWAHKSNNVKAVLDSSVMEDLQTRHYWLSSLPLPMLPPLLLMLRRQAKKKNKRFQSMIIEGRRDLSSKRVCQSRNRRNNGNGGKCGSDGETRQSARLLWRTRVTLEFPTHSTVL